MSEYIDKTIFADLDACDPKEVVSRTGCKYDQDTNQYLTRIWEHDYCVDLNTYKVRFQGDQKDGLKTYHDFLYLFILYYLMKSKDIQPSKVWISEKDIPGGEAFFRGPHTIPCDVVTKRFGNDLDYFKKVSIKFKGTVLDMADAAFSFNITPTIPVAVLYYFGDEDFPCEAKLLFDKTIGLHLPLDIIFSLAVEVCNTLGNS